MLAILAKFVARPVLSSLLLQIRPDYRVSMTERGEQISFDQMKGTIGGLLMLWSDIERSLNVAVEALLPGERARSVRGISRSLDAWSEQVMLGGPDRRLQTDLCRRLVGMLKEALVVRNFVCHGLNGISAQGGRANVVAHLRVELGDEKRIITWHEFQAMFVWMSRGKWLIEDLTAAALEPELDSSRGKIAAWEGFPKQK